MTSTQPSTNPAERLERLLRYVAADPANERLRADVFDTALAAGVFDEAQRQVVWALTRDPVDFAWRHRLVLLDMAREEWDEARVLLQSLKNEGQAGPAIEYNLAYVDFAQGRIGEAESRLRALTGDALVQVPQGLAVLLSCQHRRGAPEEAVATFAGFATRVDSASAFGAASLAAIDAEDLAAAAAWADQALARDRQQPEALVAKATLLVAGKEPRAALELLSVLLARKPDDGRALSTAALAELLAGRVPAARALFERSVVTMPRHIGTWLGFGWCDVFLNNLGGARASFETALALDPTFGESHGALAVVAALEGRRAEAETSIRRARGLDPRGLSAQYAQGVLDGETSDPERFMAHAQSALRRHSTPDGRTLDQVVLARRDGR